MTCGGARELLNRELDDRLEGAERAALARHLAGCADCRAERQRWNGAARALRGTGPTSVPAGLATRCWQVAVHAAPMPSPSLAAWFVAAARPAALAGAVAALLVWVLAAGAAPRRSAPEPGSQDPMELAIHLWTAEVGGDAF